MAFDRAATIALARRTVHNTMSVAWDYSDTVQTVPVAVAVRWISKQVMDGDLSFQGWPQQVTAIDRIVFDSEELDLKGVSLRRGGVLTAPAGSPFVGAVLILDTQEPDHGPINRIWRVAQQ